MIVKKLDKEIEVRPRPVAFRHFVDEGRTFAVPCLFRDELSAAVKKLKNKKTADLKMFVGVARLHPKDAYCKKIGRDTACENISEIVGLLQSSFVNENGTEYIVRVGDAEFRYYRNHGTKQARLQKIKSQFYQEL